MAEPPTLIAKAVRFGDLSDELMFFAWLDRMAVVSDYEGRGDELFIRLARFPDDDDLRELIAFHRRYAIDMHPLAAFRTPENEGWFAAPHMYWHDAVFGPAAAEGNAPPHDDAAYYGFVLTGLFGVIDDAEASQCDPEGIGLLRRASDLFWAEFQRRHPGAWEEKRAG